MEVNPGFVLQVLSAIAVVIGAFWALVKVIVSQFQADLGTRFAAMEQARVEGQAVWNKRLQAMEDKTAALDADVRRILIELPREYVNRTDYVRRETIIEGKIDQLSLRIQNWILENRHGGG